MRTITIPAARPYDVLLGGGLMQAAGEKIAALHAPCRCAVITDTNVRPLYGDTLTRSLRAAGFAPEIYAFPAGEKNKNWRTLGAALNWLGDSGFSRSDLIVALGGGVAGDLAGFAAAVYERGVDFVQLPTTLLAAVDASVGGKTAVDLACGKNMAGAFHQPLAVLCDTDALAALPAALLRDGAAEMLKCGLLADEALFAQMESGAWRETLPECVARCVEIKRDFVARDERDCGVRQMLNLGHTFGHAIEACSRYGWTHGQAVGMGLLMAARVAKVSPGRVRRALSACGLPTDCPFPATALAQAALHDKKRRGDEITLVLPVSVGVCALRRVPVDELPAYFAAGREEAPCER